MTRGAKPVTFAKALQGALAGLAAAALLLPAGAEAAASKASVAVRVSVLPTLQLQTVAVRPSYVVSSADAASLTSWIPDAATIEVLCNLHGYSLRFDIVDPAVVEVEVDGLDAPVKIGAVGSTVYIPLPQGRATRNRHTLGYHVRYAEGVAPGTRGVPVMVSVGNI